MADSTEKELVIELLKQTQVSKENVKKNTANSINLIRLRCLLLRFPFAEVLERAASIFDEPAIEASLNTIDDAANDINDIRRIGSEAGIPFREILDLADSTYAHLIQ